MGEESMARKQGEVGVVRPTLHEMNKAKSKKELMKRLNYIQHLARQKNYTEIKRLLQESYV